MKLKQFGAQFGAVEEHLRNLGWSAVRLSFRYGPGGGGIDVDGIRPCGHRSVVLIPEMTLYSLPNPVSNGRLCDLADYQLGRCQVCVPEIESDLATYLPPRYKDMYKRYSGWEDEPGYPSANWVNRDRDALLGRPQKMTPAEAINRLADVIHSVVNAWATDVVDDTMRFAAAIELDLNKPPAKVALPPPKPPEWARSWRQVADLFGFEPEEPAPEWHNQLELT